MPTPLASMTNTTATGDLVTGPGYPTMLAKGLPVVCVGDLVTGTVCVGAITVSTAVNKLVGGRPVADLTAVVTGANPITGVPITTALAVTPNVNILY